MSALLQTSRKSMAPLLLRAIAGSGTCRVASNSLAVRGLSGSAVLNAGHRQFFLTPSRFAWKKIKDSYHYYIMWGLLPCFAIMSYANFFYGPSILVPIPEGYIPQEYEYYKSPITRWFVKHYLDTDVQTYHERRMQYQYEIAHLELVKDFKRDVKEKMKAEDDYQAFYYRPVVAKNYRLTRKAEEDRRYIAGNE